MNLKDRVAIVTGASRGLGLAIAQAYAEAGAGLILAARDGKLLEQVAEDISRIVPQRIEWICADVSKMSDIDAIRNCAVRNFGRVDILVNNAGQVGPIGKFEEVDWRHWCETLQTNLFGIVAMSRVVVPLMKRDQYGKIINLSGGGATTPLPRFSAYAASKAAVVRFTETIAEELSSSHIDVNAIAPGALNTRMLDQVLDAGPELAGEGYYRRSLKQQGEGGASMDKAAELAVFLASAESDGLTGRLISAVWDDWRKISRNRERIQQSDVYTLRRIIPEDRDMEFQD